VLLVLAPLASLSLAGQEHGRTIPLPDIRPPVIRDRSTLGFYGGPGSAAHHCCAAPGTRERHDVIIPHGL